MAKRRSDKEIQSQIHHHSRNVREFLEQSHQIHEEAIEIGLSENDRQAHILTMERVIAFQRLAIAESKQVIRLQNILFNRQRKLINKEDSEL